MGFLDDIEPSPEYLAQAQARVREMDNKRIFEGIYKKKVWGEGSGTGSDPEYCRKFLDWFNTFIIDNNIHKVVDLGCGDCRIANAISTTEYIGVDVVEFDRATLPYKPWRLYVTCDFTSDLRYLNGLSKWTVVLLKDVLQHWDDEQVEWYLGRLLHTQRYYHVVMVNDYKYTRKKLPASYPRNVDNRYHWAPIDFTLEPWSRYGGTMVMHYRKKQVMHWRPTCS